MSRILADKVTNYNNDGPFEAEKGINIPIARPLQIGGNAGISGQYLSTTGSSLFSGNYNDLTNKPSLFSGSYTDLSNKPAILNIDINLPASNDYLKYDGNMWVNSELPPIYQYNLSTSFNEDNGIASIVLTDQFFEETSVSLMGNNGITISTNVNGDIIITAPTVTQYNEGVAKDDISEMFLNGTNTGISYTYNPITKTINSSVSLAEQLVYTLNGSSEDPNTAKIYLDNGTVESGAINLVGENGINLSWNIGTSTITLSKTDPAPYVLPVATTTTLGGVIPDSSDFNVDSLGNLTVNFPSSGIGLTDLSIATEALPSGNGNLSYDNTTGQFTYTPPEFSIDDLSDVSLSGTPSVNSLLQWNGTVWDYAELSTLGFKLDDLDLVDDLSGANQYDVLNWDGNKWISGSVYLGNQSIHFLEDVGPGLSTDPSMTIEENSVLAWNSLTSKWIIKKLVLNDFDVSTQPTDQQLLVWNATNSYWTPTSISTLVPSVGITPTFQSIEIIDCVYEQVTNNFNTALTPVSGVFSVSITSSPVIVGALTDSVTKWGFVDVDVSAPKAVTVSLIIDSNSLYTYGDACSVNGIDIIGGIRWAGGIPPLATNNEDMLSFTIITDGAGTTRVYGSSTLNYS
jgi:hypothetical protein